MVPALMILCKNGSILKCRKQSESGYIFSKELSEPDLLSDKPTAKLLWLGKKPSMEYFVQSKKGNQREMAGMKFQTSKGIHEIQVPKAHGDWLAEILEMISIKNQKICTLKEIKEHYEAAGLEDFELFMDNKPVVGLGKIGLLRL